MKKSKNKKIYGVNQKNRRLISRLDFSNGHYLKSQFDSDMYYVGVANELSSMLSQALDKPSQVKELSLILTHYLEDLVSGTGIWQAFVSLCRKKYGRSLPFYEIEESNSLDFPCQQAVNFLLWYYMDGIRENTFVNPQNPFIEELATMITHYLLIAYDEAPDEALVTGFSGDDESIVPLYYQVRNYCLWLCEDCYLTKMKDFDEMVYSLADELAALFGEDVDDDQIVYGAHSYLPFNSKIGPVNVSVLDWLKEILICEEDVNTPEIAGLIQEMQSIKYNVYKYEKVGEDWATLIDVEGNNKYELSAFTLPDMLMPSNVKEGDSCITSLVYYNGKWNVNGISSLDMDGKAFDEFKENFKREKTGKKATYDYLMKKLNNNPIGVVSDFEELSTLLELPEEDYNVGTDIDQSSWTEILYFINKDSAISLLPDCAGCVKIKGNKMYDKERAKQEGVSLILNTNMSTEEMRNYLIDNNLIPDAAIKSIISEEAGHKLFQENISFLNDYASRDDLSLGFVEFG